MNDSIKELHDMPPSHDHAFDGVGQSLDRRGFLIGAGASAAAGVIAANLTSASSVGAAAPNGASAFEALPKAVRVVDTRTPGDYTFTRLANNRIRLQLAGNYGIAEDATAVVATVTGVNGSQPNFVTVFPSGAAIPTISDLNLPFPDEINANLVTVKIGAGGSTAGAIDVYSRVPCDAIVDVVGFYRPVEGEVRAGRFVGLATAHRAIDTRKLSGPPASRSTTVVDLSAWVPAHASSVVVNLTATETSGPGYFTVYADEESSPPLSSSLNVTYAGQTRASAVIAPVNNHGGRRRIKIYTLTTSHLIVDIVGYYTGDESSSSEVGLFVPVEPTRVLDSRDPGQIGKLWPRWVVEGKVPGDGASEGSAIVATLTGVASRGPGYLTISAARQTIPPTSNVNWGYANAVVPNHVITPITASYGYQVFSSHGCHVLVDYKGFFTGTPQIPKYAAYVNPPPPSIPPPWRLIVPKAQIDAWVYDGHPDLVDNGDIWHWTGTGDMGQSANVAVFGHRTEGPAPWYNGGIFRLVDYLVPGDEWYVLTLDGREFTYRMVRRDLTDAQNTNILNAVRTLPTTSFSLVACTVGYDSSKSRYPDAWAPTSLKYRIVVTGELVSWREI